MSNKTDIWMPLYIGDYLSDTARLTTEQHGAYLLLLMDYWKSGKLPDNDLILAQISKLSPDAWSNAKAMLMQFFTIENGYWIHQRVEKELTKSVENKTKYHNRAVKGAKARWDNALSNASSNTNAMLEQCSSPSPSPSSLPTTTTSRKTISTPDGVSDSVFKDYIQLRNKLKAPVTETAIKGLEKEAQKANMSLEAVMVICCQNGWRGFKADWVKDKTPNNQNKERNQSVLSGLTRGLLGSDKNVGLLGK